jgi:hypothetical protein
LGRFHLAISSGVAPIVSNRETPGIPLEGRLQTFPCGRVVEALVEGEEPHRLLQPILELQARAQLDRITRP